VGPGDRFQISLWGRLEADYSVQVDREGKLQLPRIGPVKVGGLTYAEARSRLIGKAEAITGVSASVMLAHMRSVQVFVVGEAEKPGTVTLSPLSTVVQAVLAAGGPTPIGSLRNVVLKRAGKTNGTLDFYAFLQRGENPDDRPLHAGDVIVIPKAERLVKLYGKVKRQGIYELKAPEGLRALLGFAGGLSPDAYGGRIQVERNDKNQANVVLNVSLPELRGDFPLQDGDVVRVFPLETDLANKVGLYGHVYQPGIYAYSEGMRVSDLLGSAENLKPEVDLSYAVILREEGKDRAKTTIPFRLDAALGGQNTAGNPPLRARDEVYVFPRDQFRPPLRAKATGEVRTPGIYRFEQGARVADLVRLAGGLNSDALLAQGELLRYLPDRRRETRYVDLGKALAGDPDQNLPLSTEDELVVHPAGDRLSREVVVIEGEVNGIQAQEKEAKKGEEPRGKTIQERLTEILDKEKAEEQNKKNEEKAKERAQSEKRKASVSKTPFENTEKVLTAEEEEEQKDRREKEKEKERQKEQEEERKRTTLEIGLTQGMTVRDLVFKAGGLTKDAYLPVAHLYRTDPDTREVTIRTFDLGRAMGGDPTENLELHDLDHVVIHSAFEFVPIQRVLASGMVGKPGEHPYARNMRVRDLVIAAGGLREEAYLAQAEIVRTLVSQGQTTESHTIAFSLEKAMAGDPAANLPLEPYDKLFVKKVPEWKQDRKVELLGEVTFPGVYYIAKGEKLSSVLRRAGGYTSDAYLPGAFFTRESARQQQQQRLNELRDQLQQAIFRASSQEVQGALSAEDVAAQKQFLSSQESLLQKLEAVQATGRVVVKLLPTEELERSEWDIVLEDGDKIAIPKRPQTVTVVGQVYNPTSFLWEPDHRTVGHYLQKTGGPTPDADAKNMYVVRADGTVVSSQSLSAASWWSRGIEKLDLSPGDTILVPEKVTRVAWLREIRDVTQIIYQIAVAAGVAVTLLP
jgi:protein involved in polysaccharide export with SLBB domain